MKMTRLRTLATAAAMAMALTACDTDGPAEEAGEDIDNAVERAGEKIEEAGDRIQDHTDR